MVAALIAFGTAGLTFLTIGGAVLVSQYGIRAIDKVADAYRAHIKPKLWFSIGINRDHSGYDCIRKVSIRMALDFGHLSDQTILVDFPESSDVRDPTLYAVPVNRWIKVPVDDVVLRIRVNATEGEGLKRPLKRDLFKLESVEIKTYKGPRSRVTREMFHAAVKTYFGIAWPKCKSD